MKTGNGKAEKFVSRVTRQPRYHCSLTSSLHNLFLHSEPPLPVTLLPIGSCCFRAKSFSCINTPTVLSSSHTSYHLPMKMEQTECSETSAFIIQTPGNYPKENTQFSERGESLKARMLHSTSTAFLGLLNSLDCQELHRFTETQRLIIDFNNAHHWTLS